MKKLQLNKETIAQITNLNQVIGGNISIIQCVITLTEGPSCYGTCDCPTENFEKTCIPCKPVEATETCGPPTI